MSRKLSFTGLFNSYCVWRQFAFLCFSVLVFSSVMPQAVSAITINEYPVPTAGSNPFRIAAGSDCNLWFTEYDSNKIGKITTAGDVTEYPIPTASSQPRAIIPGPDGNIWFTEYNGNNIGKITTAGVITEYAVPTANSQPRAIAPGPDGNLWFTEYNGNNIGKITTAGVITEYPIPTANSQPGSIRKGFDKNLWFVEQNGNKIGKITTAGVITEYPIPFVDCSNPGDCNPITAVRVADGNIWFTVQGTNGNWIGRITMAGIITEFPIPTGSSKPGGIAAGPDGNVWFTEQNGNNIGQVVINASLGKLSISKIGSGTGVVESSPSRVICDASGCACPAFFPLNSVVGLAATPSVGGSIFSGWSGDADCSDGVVTQSLDISCTATFDLCPGQPALINLTGYDSVGLAYAGAAASGDTIKVTASNQQESIDFNSDKSIILRGGYNCAFATEVSYTIVTGSLTVSSGDVEVENIAIY